MVSRAARGGVVALALVLVALALDSAMSVDALQAKEGSSDAASDARCGALLSALRNLTGAGGGASSSGTGPTSATEKTVGEQLEEMLTPTINLAAFFPIFFDFPHLRQEADEESTAFAAAASLLRGFGLSHTTAAVRSQLVSDSNNSLNGGGGGGGGPREVSLRGIAGAIASLAPEFSAAPRVNMSIFAIRHALAKGSTALLVAYQPTSARPTATSPWLSAWSGKQVAVVFGIDARNLYLVDPERPSIAEVGLNDFADRWHVTDPEGVSGFCHHCAVEVALRRASADSDSAAGAARLLRTTTRPSFLVPL